MSVAGLLLAAGAGSRLGRPKALVEVGGELLVDRAARMLAAAGCDPVVVVLGAAADEVADRATLDGATVLVNDGWARGMGSSLRTGLHALTEMGSQATVVALVDQPHVTSEVVRRLLDARADGHDAVVASYDDQPRNPVLLEAACWDEVCAAAVGDEGARAWLRAHPQRVRVVACDDLGDATDVDEPEDLRRLVEDTR